MFRSGLAFTCLAYDQNAVRNYAAGVITNVERGVTVSVNVLQCNVQQNHRVLRNDRLCIKSDETTGAVEPTSAAVRNRHRQKAMR